MYSTCFGTHTYLLSRIGIDRTADVVQVVQHAQAQARTSTRHKTQARTNNKSVGALRTAWIKRKEKERELDRENSICIYIVKARLGERQQKNSNSNSNSDVARQVIT